MLKTKIIALATTMSLVSGVAIAETVKATVKDYYTTVTEMVPFYKQECGNVQVPIYGTTTQQGNAAGGALTGMIIGGILGKAAGGNDKGAAAGAIIGGLVGADKGAKPKTSQTVVGYKTERRCEQVEHWKNQQTRVYDYSTITWKENGKNIVIEFLKP